MSEIPATSAGSQDAQPPISELGGLLRRYEDFARQRSHQRLDEFERGFGHLKTGMISVLALRDEIEKAEAPRYNVLELLGMAHDEDRMHTPFLADLFNPHGRHGQGHLFLRELLVQCADKMGFPRPAREVDATEWFVETQRTTSYGNLDMVISCPELRYLLVIENKIYAGEQEGQIRRYYDWMETRGRFYGQRALIYLTPDGRKAETNDGRPYFRLSYRRDMAELLQRALLSICAPRAVEMLKQYLDVITRL